MKTQQIGAKRQPKESDTTLAIIIRCPDCGTQRAFKINDVLNTLILPRNTSGEEWRTWCEECGRYFTVQLCWTERKLGWTVEKITLENVVVVEDYIGLTKTTKEKAI